jgi:UDP:flavonoid glycosyltransferase YjiC (YdhE family)
VAVRVLATTHPGSGHLHPLVPLLRGLRDRGHEVLVATARSFCPAVEAVGLPTVAVGHDWLESEATTTLPGFVESSGPAQLVFFAQLAAEAVADIEKAAVAWGADLILRDSVEYGGWIVAERLGIPHVECGIVVALGGTVLARLTGEALPRLLDAFGLAPDPDLKRPSEHLYLDFLPPSFTPDFVTPPETRRTFRPDIFDASGTEQVPPWWGDLRDSERPIVYATLGTVYNQAPEIFGKIIAAFVDQPIEAVITVGRNSDLHALSPTPPNVHVERYIPQSAILGDCDAVISHGGCNTLIAAIASGLPLVCMPFSADQPVNAARCEELGIGKSLANHLPDGSPFRVTQAQHLSPDDIREAVQEVMKDGRYAQAAKAMQAEMAALPGVDAAVDAICEVMAGWR